MPNRLLTIQEVNEEIWKQLFEGKTEEEQRAIAYDLQIWLGKFKASKKERDCYIKTENVSSGTL